MTLLPFAWTDGPGPVSQRLTAALRAAVVEGRLQPTERLPSSRLLAADLGVSRWVVTEAYEQLVAEGHLSGRTGAGTFVADLHRSPPVAQRPARVAAPVVRYDLRPNQPDLRAFPYAAWRAAGTRAAASLGPYGLGLPDPHGDARLRQVLADYLRRVRGLAADPDDVLVTSGTGAGLAVLFRALALGGHTRVAVEDPGWARVPAAVTAAGLDPVPVPVDGDGLVTARLAGLDVSAVCVTPSHQFPTGVALDAARRRQLLEWATGARLLVEDDYDAEFRYDRRPVSALAGLGAERVAYLGSTSKTLAPGLRIGWLVVRGAVQEAVREVLAADSAGPSTLDQRTLAELMAGGAYDAHLRRMRRAYRDRRTAFVRRLQEAVPGGRVVGLDAGVHCLLELDSTDDVLACALLAQHGIVAQPLSACRSRPALPAGLLLGYGNLPEHAAREVAAAVAAAVALSRRSPRAAGTAGPGRPAPGRAARAAGARGAAGG